MSAASSFTFNHRIYIHIYIFSLRSIRTFSPTKSGLTTHRQHDYCVIRTPNMTSLVLQCSIFSKLAQIEEFSLKIVREWCEDEV